MTYAEAIDYLFSRLPMFTRIGAAAYKADLTNIIALSEALGDPHKQFRSIHVAGTNGKGSVSHMLASVLQTAGYKTGLFTSPHLHDFRERIRINGQMIPEANVIDFVKRTESLVDKIRPSFFEITAAMAFEFFAKEKVDIAVIEVGLGGRLDSTNIITPELSVITNIGWDHMNILGDSLEIIAGEKAGIIKEGVPVVIGERQMITDAVFESAAEVKQAQIFFADDEYKVISSKWEGDDLCVEVKSVSEDLSTEYCLDLPGIYQSKNLCTVLIALKHLNKEFEVSADAISKGLSEVRKLTGFAGRWEKIGGHPDIILDVGHNESGVRELIRQVSKLSFDQLHIVIGMVKDKDISNVLSLMPVTAKYYFTNAHIPRALPAHDLQQQAAVIGLQGNVFEEVNEAIRAAKEIAGEDDLILVCGSVFVVAEVRR